MTTESELWQACPEGEISRMAAGLRGARRRKTIVRAGAVAAYSVLVCAVLVAAVIFNSKARSNYGDLTCKQVVGMLDEYQSARLDDNLTTRVKTHLAQCKSCRTHYEKLQARADEDSFLVAMVDFVVGR